MRATIFAVLNRLQNSGGTRPTLQNVWSGRCATTDLYQLPELRDVNARSLDPDYRPSIDHVSIEEARTLVADGVCDVQSHGPDHMVHYTSERLTGFITPKSHWTALAAAHGDRRLGTPIYETGSVLVKPRYCDPQAVRDRLAGLVAEAGGPEFFNRTDWAATLHQEFEAIDAHRTGRFESGEAWRAAVSEGLRTCIGELSVHTGSDVHTLAWPFGSSSVQSQELALQAGFAVALTSRGGGYLADMPRAAIGRISLKVHDADQFRLALLRHSDAAYVRQQFPVRPDDGPLPIAV
jgi:hypothetical protein